MRRRRKAAGQVESRNKSFQWPIGHEVMRDPVMARADGHTYEREAIEEWIQGAGARSRSPMTTEIMEACAHSPC